MGYRGKVEAQSEARRLRAESLTLADIATRLGVSKSSVSIWVRDVPFTPSKRRHGPHRRPHAQHVAKLRQIEELDAAGRERIGTLSQDAFLVAGVALYAGEGAKAGCQRHLHQLGSDDDSFALRVAAPFLRRRRSPAPSPRLPA